MPDPRPVYEDFECGPSLRLQSHEKVSKLQNDALHERIARLEALVERLEKRLWLTVFGIVGAILAQAFQSILDQLP
ncbi:hypothetical protein KM176_10305 [Pseudooceanicola sp. CBS1P-1]|uniref:Uncharacterized protein n=1 Tax=Pseudooceanicola albus TaxID=2692189 RepID=A0A6L7GC63_9RHOB|nr:MULTISPECIES: hypothetical protein [Pseudooceanicola]MBT9384248.1 hypothetical protein [Pseudooceanicola endophyticus]MXN20840.1 hypothetical protein [Pseudooceanicola albus]